MQLLGLQAACQTGSYGLGRASLRTVLEISFALAFLVGIRTLIVTGLGAQSWYEVFTVFPDFVTWVWIFALVMLLTGVIRTVMIVRARQIHFHEAEQALETAATNS